MLCPRTELAVGLAKYLRSRDGSLDLGGMGCLVVCEILCAAVSFLGLWNRRWIRPFRFVLDRDGSLLCSGESIMERLKRMAKK